MCDITDTKHTLNFVFIVAMKEHALIIPVI